MNIENWGWGRAIAVGDGEGTKTEIRRVEMKIPFPLMRKGEILSMLQKFLESWFFRNLILCISLIFSLFAKIIQVCGNTANFCQLPRGFSPVLHMFRKNIWENKYFCEKISLRQMFSRKSAKMSLKYFYKNGRFASHVDDNVCLFCKKLKEKSTIVNFR